ncbi:UNVERIFIED_CONTAM: hypothetical protein GTU68_013545 [Idotea baltica]|nr:hypothetical protein [Idotea baltica]
MKRWAGMAKAFTRAGREISIAVKAGGPDPDNNASLRVAMQNAKNVNMPKERVLSAIKKASDKDTSNYEEITYEGYAPHGVAIFVDCATDNPVRTVANVRHYFSKHGGSLGTSGSLSFIFNRKGLFKLNPEGLDADELELELIDHGLEELQNETDADENPEFHLYCEFTDFGMLQAALEAKGIEAKSAELVRLPLTTVEIDEEQAPEVMKIIDKMEEDEDVLNVWTNLA